MGEEQHKMLIIGGTATASIGHAIVENVEYYFPGKIELFVPTIKELDVTNRYVTDNYISANGPFTYVVYSAGMQRLGFIDGLDIDEVEDIFDLNVYGFLRVMSSLVAQQDSGKVCAIVSNAATTPMRGSVAYCSSKAALEMAVKCAARELAPAWTITGVSPGPVEGTPMSDSVDQQVCELRGWTMEYAMAYEKSLIPMGRRSSREEIAKFVMSMLINSEMLTGQVVSITGGRT